MLLSLDSLPALVLIDFQQGFDDIDYWGGERNNPEAETNAARLLAYWREHQLPIFHVQHCSTNPASRLAPGQSGHAFKREVAPRPDEVVIQKTVNSAFIGTDLRQQLDEPQLTTLVFAGLTTDHCVSTSVRMARNLGFKTFLVADACATFSKRGINSETFSAELIHQTALASLQDEFATVLTATEAIRQLEARQHSTPFPHAAK
ncbi:cysteine hydrolase [Hymenobacter sp. BT664]|uniref:Cysteine hydrolase n=1 Tax=Hymenobacter montanus TaxID=2771359 RepID=A0A927GJH7_9BACT|nr:cysteine hydrolase family protein [Hymenobacter montanus]MBD2768507.1 cysteine hydrolase [Hymenobacter montanus]